MIAPARSAIDTAETIRLFILGRRELSGLTTDARDLVRAGFSAREIARHLEAPVEVPARLP